MKNKLETVYFLLPEIIQDLIFSIYGIYLRALRFGRIYGSNLNNLLESEWCSENEITRYQEIKFMESLRIAFDHSEFYKFWFNKPLKNGVFKIRSFLHPLDSVKHWNRDYCKKGLILYKPCFR